MQRVDLEAVVAVVLGGVVVDEAQRVAVRRVVDKRRAVLVEQERLGDQRADERAQAVAEVHRLHTANADVITRHHKQANLWGPVKFYGVL